LIIHLASLSADAIHSLTDLISDFTTLATVSYSVRTPTSRFPTGYGKIESLGALGVSGILLSGGIMIGLQAVMALAQQFFPDIAHILSHIAIFGGHGHSHSHGAQDLGPNINAAWLAAGSIVIKEWLYRATMKIAVEKRSSVLASNAYHHRVDSLTAVVALATITASHFITNAAWLDPVGGLIISGMIVQAGYGNTKAALLELADVSIDADLKHKLQSAALQALSDTKQAIDTIPQVQGIKSGQNYLIEVAVSLPSSCTLAQMTQTENSMRAKIAAASPGIKRVSVRFTTSPVTADAFANEFVLQKDKASVLEQEPEQEHDHHHGGSSHDHEHMDHASSSKEGLVKRK
jgi:cation diffusion facilitator family transporter